MLISLWVTSIVSTVSFYYSHICCLSANQPAKKPMIFCVYLEHIMSLQLPYSTTNQSSLNMRGLYSSLLPPDISCLAGRPAIMFSAWVESEPEREVSCSLFSGPRDGCMVSGRTQRDMKLRDGAMKAAEEWNEVDAGRTPPERTDYSAATAAWSLFSLGIR